MQINSIIDIVDGVLLNAPSISFIYNIKNNPKRVIEGDLFISSNEEDISLAIKNGAFAIIVDKNTIITDSEIAWIKVESIENALIRLFRFKLATVQMEVYCCDAVTFDLLQLYKSNNKNIKFISDSLEESLKMMEELNSEDILFCTNQELLDKIYPNNSAFNKSYEIENLVKHSLFETTFSCNNDYFSKLKMPSLYLKQFLDLYYFFNGHIDETKLKKLSHLKPIFIDKFLSIIEFGKSNKFLMVQKNYELVHQEIAYIKNHYKYATTLFISKDELEHIDEEIRIMSSLQQLKHFLKNKSFNCLYIMGYEYDEVEHLLSQSTHQQSLL